MYAEAVKDKKGVIQEFESSRPVEGYRFTDSCAIV